MFEAVFVGLLAAAAYPVILYPALVLLLARLRPRRWQEGQVDLPVAHVITAHDEEQRIAAKLDDALAVEAPAGSFIVVADDGSTDRTREVVARYAARGVIWVGCPRRGKEQAQLEAIRRTTAPILVFSDVSTTLEPHAVRELLRPFADPRVAAVSGTDRLAGAKRGVGEDLYVGFEMAVRRAESLAGTLVGLSGCFFAVRREVATELLPDVPSDMGAALVAIRSGGRAVAADGALCRYVSTPAAAREFTRKRRTVLRGLRALGAYRGVLGFARPIASWQLISHKWFRFAIPLFLVAALVTAAAAAVVGRTWAQWLVAAAGVVLVVGVVAVGVPALRRVKALRAAAFFVVSAAAVLAAWFDLARGARGVTWTPTKRTGAEG